MDPILQGIKDDIQATITSKISGTANPAKVLATDESRIMKDIVDAIDTLSTPPDSNFDEYDPAKVYSNALPDYVSYEGNIYKYINATPTAGATPDESPTFWELSSSGAFAHQQNTDQYTVNRTFEVGKQTGAFPEGVEPPGYYAGSTVYIFGGAYGGNRKAIRHRYDADPETAEPISVLEYTESYTGGADTWVPFVTGAEIASLDDRVADLETFAVTAATDINNKANKTLAINTQTANYTLVLADAGNMVRMNVGTANTLTVPTNATVAFPIGTQIVGSQAGAGQTTFVAASGVTINSAGSKYKTAVQFAAWTLIKTGTDTWLLSGTLTT